MTLAHGATTPPDRPVPAPSGSTLVRRVVDCPLGPLVLVAGARGLRAVLWPGEDGSRVAGALRDPGPGPGAPVEAEPNGAEGPLDRAATHLDHAATHLDRVEVQLAEYFAGSRRHFDLALDPAGTPFQLRAWQVLATIPFGATMTYREQAAVLGDPRMARAVGAADGRNPLSIVVPCHRVVGSTGRLTGFAGGLPAKEWLLDHERRVLACS